MRQRRIVVYLDGLAALARPRPWRGKLATETAKEIDALLPSVLDRAFKGEL